MDKLIVDNNGKATISNDGATIMKLLDVVHPAAKSLVDIAKSQDAEVSSFMGISPMMLFIIWNDNISYYIYTFIFFEVYSNICFLFDFSLQILYTNIILL